MSRAKLGLLAAWAGVVAAACGLSADGPPADGPAADVPAVSPTGHPAAKPAGGPTATPTGDPAITSSGDPAAKPAGGPTATPPTRPAGPLADLPSPPGPHVERIRALGDNAWLSLGRPQPDPKWGAARGRAWGGRALTFAPALGGAFFCGEGVHAYVKPDGFGQDDFWFYDINAHRWICLHPGTDTRNFNTLVKAGTLKVDEVGRVVDATGQPIPGHLLIHAFGYLGYDTDRQKFTILTLGGGGNGFGRYYMPGLKAVNEGLTKLEEQGLNKRGSNFAPWAYNARTGRFERDLAANAMPDVGGYYPQVLYVPSRKEFFVAGIWGITFFNPATRSWSELAKNNLTPDGWSLACYDSKRDRVYGGGRDTLYCYDVKTGDLTRIEKSSAYSLTYDNNRSALVYDAANDRVLCFSFLSHGDGSAHDYAIVAPLDPQTNTWGEAIPFEPRFKARMANTNAAFYDAELGVTFIYSAGDSEDNGATWVYRHKQATKP